MGKISLEAYTNESGYIKIIKVSMSEETARECLIFSKGYKAAISRNPLEMNQRQRKFYLSIDLAKSFLTVEDYCNIGRFQVYDFLALTNQKVLELTGEEIL